MDARGYSMKVEVSFRNELANFTNVAMYLSEEVEETIVADGAEALRLTLKYEKLVRRGMKLRSFTYYVAGEIIKAEGLA